MADQTRNFLEVVVPRERAQLDIVAVHGLNPFGSGSNAFSTWTAVRGAEERNWLIHEDFLPKLAPTARIMLFSYNSNAVFSASAGTVDDHARNLLEQLRQKRRKEGPDRPLIFICHSLGGLLVKRALVMAYNTDVYKIIYTSTKSVVFFATPHGGGQNVQIGNIAVSIFRTITNSQNNAFMESLRRNSLCSQTNRADFAQRAKDFQFISVIETLKTNGVTVVSKDDSVIGLADEQEKKITVDANHKDVCRFGDPDGRAFGMVKDAIEELAEEAVRAAAGTAAAGAAAPLLPAPEIVMVPYLENTKFQGREREILGIHQAFTAPQPGRQHRGQVRLVLQGFPGIGKTSIALQYSLDFGGQYEGVFWLTATSQDALARDLARFEEEVKKRTSLSFKDWCSRKKWLLIVDNLDDPSFFRPQDTIPAGPGDVLITSRRTDLNRLGTVIKVSPLGRGVARDLLLLYGENRLPEEDDAQNALRIVEMLGCVPLAIQQCGCLVSEQRGRLSSYIGDFDHLMTELAIPEEFGASAIDGPYDLNDSKPLLASFEVSFTYLSRASEDAAALLSLMANLEPTEVSLQMLERSLAPHKRWDRDGNITTEVAPAMRDWLRALPTKARGHGLREALRTLVRYSLLFSKSEEGNYFLHPLTHFWLRWKQENAGRIEAFRDTVTLLYNGFPHPEFSRTYGLTHRHGVLRATYMPHVQRLLKSYRGLERLANDDRELLFLVATVFLHASNTPEEFRPMKQRVRQNIPGTNVPLPRGRLVDPFVQDTRFLRAVEDITKQLGYPGALYLHAVYVFFEHICKEWRASHPQSAFSARDIAFAGRSLQQIRTEILAGSEGPSPAAGTLSEPLDAQDQEEIMLFRPFIPDPGTAPAANEINRALDVQSGILGLIALKYALYVRESVFESGPNVTLDPDTGGLVAFIDHRVQVPGSVALLWAFCFRSRLQSRAETLCDLTRLAHDQHLLQLFQARNDTGELNPLTPGIRAWAVKAMIDLAAMLGPESVLGAESRFMLMWDGTKSSPPRAWIPDSEVGAALDAPLTSDNFYFKVKLIDAWQYSLSARSMVQARGGLILSWLHRFSTCDRSLRGQWGFAVDPVLDLYEFAIYFYSDCLRDPAQADLYRDLYLTYFEAEYGTFHERLVLGCGVGIFGMRHARLRLISGPGAGAPGAEERAAGLRLFHSLRERLGRSGSCMPNGDTQTSRLAEQEWCHRRLAAFHSLLGMPVGARMSSLGKASWNMVYPRNDTIDDELFRVEEERIKRAVLEQVIMGSGEEDAGGSAVQDEAALPAAVDGGSGQTVARASTVPPVATINAARDGNDPSDRARPGMAEGPVPSSTSDGRGRTGRLGRLVGRLRISRT